MILNEPMTEPYRLGWKEMGEFRNDQMNKILELTSRFGNVVHIKMLGMPFYFISDPEMIRELLIGHAKSLHKDRFTNHMFKRMLGESVLTAEDLAWQKQRKIIQPVFHATYIYDFATTFAEQTHEMCQRLSVGETYPLEKEMMALTLQIICRTMFSEDVHHKMDKIDEFLNVMLIESQFQLKFGLNVPNWVPMPSYRRQNRAIKAIQDLLLDIIRQRQEQLEQGQEVPTDLLTMLLTAQYEDGQPMHEEQVLDECMTIFLAGHETTAVGLTWTWLELLQHPEILQKLTQEIAEKLGDRTISYDDLSEMPYLGQVIKEAMRLHPPAAALARDVTNPFEANGYHFKPKDTVIFHINTLHHQEAFYPEPDRFNPGRFAPDQEQPDRYAYMPFGAGSRTCVGNSFAMLEMQIVLATMIQSIQLSLVPGQEFIPELLLTLRPRDGVQVEVTSKTS